MSVHLNIKHSFVTANRAFHLDVQLQTEARRIALFGPSGSGKTLTVHAVSGLVTPTEGEIRINNQVFFCSKTKKNLAPQSRKLAYLLQDYGLFPHLTVAQNISFGLHKGLFNPPKKWVPPQAKKWIDAFELDQLLAQYPHELSGGQKQRTALARALAVGPELVLLDEPLAALDIQLRVKMRQELASLQQRLAIPSIIITHDPEDAIGLADEVFCIAEGKIVRKCSPEALYREFNSQRLSALPLAV